MSDTKKPDATVEEQKKKTDATVEQQQKTEEKVDHAANERARIESITTCDEAKGREGLASHIAFKTNMSVDDAKAMLASSPKGAASTSALDAAMAKTGGGADISNNGGDEEEIDNKEKAGGGLLDAYTNATGNKSILKTS